ncbi:MAG TPA: hypothetical protein VNA21_01365 [Steroidobacteraceae bacterium]|nr:hypothetical protein [Steroidobacteraceae bacterium]
MRQRKALAIAVLALASITGAGAFTKGEIEQLCPNREIQPGQGGRELVRDPICRSHLDMESELGINSDVRQQVIDALTDRRLAQPHGIRSSDGDKTIRAEAEKVTQMLSRVRAAIGDDRMDEFYVYMHSHRERHLLSTLTRRLPADAQLSADQKGRMKLLYLRHAQNPKVDQQQGLWAPETLYELPQHEQDLIRSVNQVARWQLNNVRTMELDAQLESEAADFLTDQQLEILQHVNKDSVRSSVKYALREWMAIDHAKLPGLQRRISSLPRQQMGLPISGNIEVEFNIQIDDRKPISGVRKIQNGTMFELEADELRIRIKPTLYKRFPPHIDIGFFTKVSDEWRRLEQPTSSGDDEHTFAMVEGVRKAYFIKTKVEVSD